jgi:hypothetical protein
MQTETEMREAALDAHSESKQRYQKPSLRCYGSVSALTMGGVTGSHEATAESDPNRPAKMLASDPVAKENVVRIGTHPLGIGLYLFDYKPEYRVAWGHGRQFGVMADEVEQVLPAAVANHPDGYRRVNYDMLGICRTLQ